MPCDATWWGGMKCEPLRAAVMHAGGSSSAALAAYLASLTNDIVASIVKYGYSPCDKVRPICGAGCVRACMRAPGLQPRVYLHSSAGVRREPITAHAPPRQLATPSCVWGNGRIPTHCASFYLICFICTMQSVLTAIVPPTLLNAPATVEITERDPTIGGYLSSPLIVNIRMPKR